MSGIRRRSTREGRRVRDRVERARNQVAALVGRPREQVVFTSGGTEANCARRAGARGGGRARGAARGSSRRPPIEHPSLRGAVAALARRGWQVRHRGHRRRRARRRPLDGVGLRRVRRGQPRARDDRRPAALVAAAHAAGALVHVDAVQAAGKLALARLAADAIAIVGAQDRRPAGRRRARDRRRRRRCRSSRAATRSAAAAPAPRTRSASSGSAPPRRPPTSRALARASPRSATASRRGLRAIGGVRIHGAERAARRRHRSTPGFAGALGESIVDRARPRGHRGLDRARPAPRGSIQPSPVLLGLGYSRAEAREAVRFSASAAPPPPTRSTPSSSAWRRSSHRRSNPTPRRKPSVLTTSERALTSRGSGVSPRACVTSSSSVPRAPPSDSFLGSLSSVSGAQARRDRHQGRARARRRLGRRRRQLVHMGMVLPAGRRPGAGAPGRARRRAAAERPVRDRQQGVRLGPRGRARRRARDRRRRDRDRRRRRHGVDVERAARPAQARAAAPRWARSSTVDSMVNDGLWDPYSNQHMGNCAELCAKEKGISRARAGRVRRRELPPRARRAEAGPLQGRDRRRRRSPTRRATISVDTDEEPGRGNIEKLPALRTAFQKDGTITAGNASSINDGAAAVVLMSRRRGEEARRSRSSRGSSSWGYHAQAPEWFTTAPAARDQERARRRRSWDAKKVDLWEINEAFAVVSVANNQLLGLDPAKVNVWGGAVALGHPIGASGARILVTLLHAMAAQRREDRRRVAVHRRRRGHRAPRGAAVMTDVQQARRRRRRADGAGHRAGRGAGRARRDHRRRRARLRAGRHRQDQEARSTGWSRRASSRRPRATRRSAHLKAGGAHRDLAECDVVIEAATEKRGAQARHLQEPRRGLQGRRDPRVEHVVDLDHEARRRVGPPRSRDRHALHEPGAADEARRDRARPADERRDLRRPRSRSRSGSARPRSARATSRASSSTAC